MQVAGWEDKAIECLRNRFFEPADFVAPARRIKAVAEPNVASIKPDGKMSRDVLPANLPDPN